VLAYLRARSEGAGHSELVTRFGEPGIKALDRLVSPDDVLRHGGHDTSPRCRPNPSVRKCLTA
jgi:hypothetical protein